MHHPNSRIPVSIDELLEERGEEWRHPRELLPLNLAALSYARDELKKEVNEERPNWSPEIEAYLEEAEIYVPAPWCAAFVNWCVRQAADLKNILSPLEKIPLQAYVPSYYSYGKNNGWLLSYEKVGPGDLFLLYYSHLGRFGHIGFVDHTDRENNLIYTIEGNTNLAGSREGTAIMMKSRSVTENVKFLRYT